MPKKNKAELQEELRVINDQIDGLRKKAKAIAAQLDEVVADDIIKKVVDGWTDTEKAKAAELLTKNGK